MNELSRNTADLVEISTSGSIRIRLLSGVAVVIWTLGIAAGTLISLQYQNTPGKTTLTTDRWPADTLCSLSSQTPTLLMFVHPRCACSRASLNELSLIATRCFGRVDIQVIFLQPSSLPADWSKTDLWETAHLIPNVKLRWDVDGVEHRRFKAAVSGEVFLYLPCGDLSFHGGITASRGHVGDNPGRNSIESLLHRQGSSGGSTPVFGCELDSPISPSRECAVHELEGTNR